MKKIFLLLSIITFISQARADEGMWLLKELNQQSALRMQELGFEFPIDSIYSESNPSLKDAVVIFGRGCTGVAVSQQGMIFTNHHCGYDAIQKLSSVNHDYLKNGFVSQSFDEELPAEGLTVSFLQSVEDITSFVTKTIEDGDNEDIRNAKIDSLSKEFLKKYDDNQFISARVVPFYSHNKYYAIVYEVFKDVRLVFTPPSSVGKFGGETDNWMWPRHTGDFSIFRVYANANNEAAGYSEDNIPYKPKYSVPVSIKGYENKDYAMTIGYPGSTERYMTSWGINQMVESEHKPRIEVRGAKQAIWREAMNADDAIRIKYASKYASSSNYWKNAMGMNEAIEKLDIIKNKKNEESEFNDWVNSNPSAKEKYGQTLSTLEQAYTNSNEIERIRTYFNETFYNGIEIVRIANTVLYVDEKYENDKKALELEERLSNTYKDYAPLLDKKVLPVLMKLYAEKVPVEFQPSIYKKISKKFGGNYDKYADWLYKNTKLTNLENLILLVQSGKTKDLLQDPAIELAKSVGECYTEIGKDLSTTYNQISKGERDFMSGLMEMDPNKVFYSDANFTQRMSYGSIGGYSPIDAVEYLYYSTTQGVLEKENPNNPEFAVQPYILKDLASDNFGEYANNDGKMHVNFLSNNDITGGNSGSPVFNKNAQLIGLAFDGNWEALSGDILFDPNLQRCINVDIRYVLYIVDKVMGCNRIIQELDIVK